MKCKPCKVTYQGKRYQILVNGTVAPVVMPGCLVTALPEAEAALVRAEAQRQRRNRNSRERHQAMTDLGMKRNRDGSYE